jgi:hypothetical protein
MMKKLTFLILLALLLRLPGLAQTVIWDETFADPPTDWTIDGNWAFDSGNLMFYYYPVVENYDFSAVSPEIQIPDYPCELSLSQFIDPYLNGVTNETCEIWVISGNEEVLIFNYEIINGTWGELGGTPLNQSLDQFSGQTVQFRFRTWGASTNSLWDWTIYNVSISTTFNNELCALDVTGPSNILPGMNGTWQVSFKNDGQLPQSDFIVRLYSLKRGDQVGAITYQGTINPSESGIVDFQWTPQDVENTCLYGLIEAPNDEFPGNNRTKSFFVRIEPPINYNVLVWDHDNGIETIYNAETGVKEQANTSIQKALSEAGIPYDLVQDLPSDLSWYDLIICTMGSYCLS